MTCGALLEIMYGLGQALMHDVRCTNVAVDRQVSPGQGSARTGFW